MKSYMSHPISATVRALRYYNDCASLIRQHLLVECGIISKEEPVELLRAPSEEEILAFSGLFAPRKWMEMAVLWPFRG